MFFSSSLVGLIEQQKIIYTHTTEQKKRQQQSKTVYIVNKRLFMVSLPRCYGMFFSLLILLLTIKATMDDRGKSQRHFLPNVYVWWIFSSSLSQNQFNVLVFCQYILHLYAMLVNSSVAAPKEENCLNGCVYSTHMCTYTHAHTHPCTRTERHSRILIHSFIHSLSRAKNTNINTPAQHMCVCAHTSSSTTPSSSSSSSSTSSQIHVRCARTK